MNKKKFFEFTSAFLLICSLGNGICISAQDKSNIHIIMTDELSAESVSFNVGNKYIYTPDNDQLAKMGIVFSNAYCANPLSVFSRSSFFTRKYPNEMTIQTNDKVIEIDQDPLGKSARLIADEGGVQTWLKQMVDESYAVGFFNTDDYGKIPQSYFRWGNAKPTHFEIKFSQLGLNGKWRVRDVWRQKNITGLDNSLKILIPNHGVMMYRLFQIK